LPVTDGLSDATEPHFDRSGKYLYFFTSTDAGPVNNWFSLENNDLRVTRSIWLAVLRSDLPNPLVKESDEEKGSDAEKAKTGAGAAAKAGEDKDSKPEASKTTEPVRIDFDGLATRILDLPVGVADLSTLRAGSAGQIFFVRAADGKSALQRFDLKDRKTE